MIAKLDKLLERIQRKVNWGSKNIIAETGPYNSINCEYNYDYNYLHLQLQLILDCSQAILIKIGACDKLCHIPQFMTWYVLLKIIYLY